MKNALAVLFGAILLLASCDSNDDDQKRDTLGYFQERIHADMNFETLEKNFGQPDGDIGSGVHIYVYNLDDGTKIQIGFVDKIIYARQVDQNNKVIVTLI
jgi:hypothetical protein